MVSHCANSNCAAPFRFMHTGRIYRFDFAVEGSTDHIQDILWDENGIPRRTEMFWLCDECMHHYTLEQDASGNVVLRPIAAARASD